MSLKSIDNINELLKDDLSIVIKKGSKVSIAAAYFSMYAYQELRKQLENIGEFRFIFTSPTFTKDQEEKQKREFYIPRLQRETSLYGTEFEIKLRNELTQKSIAKECAEWIKNKATFKSNQTREYIQGLLIVESNDDNYLYTPINGFTTVDIGCDQGNQMFNFVNRIGSPESQLYISAFESIWNDHQKLQDVTEEVINSMTSAYQENSPESIYFLALYQVFSEFLEDISEDELPNDATGFKESKVWSLLYDFQRDAVLAIINKLEKYNGCILADSVGLGKTFTSLAVIKYYENRNKSVLVLCPKKLSDNWNTYKENYVNNPLSVDRLNYDVLFHTDLSRNSGASNGIDLDRLNWQNYDLIVIDESHNFRNGYGTNRNNQVNRYEKLLEKVIKPGVKTKVLMLSATPVNNRFLDLKNQLSLAYEGESEKLNRQLNTSKSIEDIFKHAQAVFNNWNKLEPEHRTTQNLLQKLDFDFFELLDSVTIARSRKHIEKYYDINSIGKFPERLNPISIRTPLKVGSSENLFNDIYKNLMQLTLSVYSPTVFIFDSKKHKYLDLGNTRASNLTQSGREEGIKKLMSINLLKRLESSIHSFRLTLLRIQSLINSILFAIDMFEKSGQSNALDLYDATETEFDIDDSSSEIFSVGKKVKIDLADIDVKSWKYELEEDIKVLNRIIHSVEDITPEKDRKLQELMKIISNKIENPINPQNKKVIVFSAFADTALYIYEHLSSYVKDKYQIETAVVTGSIEGKTTLSILKPTLNNVLTCFSPISKGREKLMPNSTNEIDLLIATDCISEGQNLQDCDYLINYDIHWNPVRIIQRFGRIDRIGSKNEKIQLVNFWPDLNLDEYINLKNRVETRMKITVMTSTGDDDLINAEEKGDLEYRKQQLQRLQDEVVDLEDMTSGISIMDLGLNEFRLDLLDYIKTHPDIEKKPKGLHSVVNATDEHPEGIIFVLKNIHNDINIDNKNRIHPFYMVYITNEGEVHCDYLNPKKLLDELRRLCRGKSDPVLEAYSKFNEETEDGKKMDEVSDLLNEAIYSIVDVKEESDIDSLFSFGGTSALLSDVHGLEDFELVCFLVVKQ